METTFDETADDVRASGRKLKRDAKQSASDLSAVASAEIKSLIADVEELVARVSDLKDADVVRVRTKVLGAVDAAKETLAGRAQSVRRQAQRAVATADDFVHDSPWSAVGIAALVGAVVGILALRRN